MYTWHFLSVHQEGHLEEHDRGIGHNKGSHMVTAQSFR